MKSTTPIGEFEHLVLLAILRLPQGAHAVTIRNEIEERAERRVSRGALYATLERLEEKGFVTWSTEATTPARGGIPRRTFVVTDPGVAAVRVAQRAIGRLAEGIEEALR